MKGLISMVLTIEEFKEIVADALQKRFPPVVRAFDVDNVEISRDEGVPKYAHIDFKEKDAGELPNKKTKRQIIEDDDL